jgi:hypothetical protein
MLHNLFNCRFFQCLRIGGSSQNRRRMRDLGNSLGNTNLVASLLSIQLPAPITGVGNIAAVTVMNGSNRAGAMLCVAVRIGATVLEVGSTPTTTKTGAN